MVNFSMMNEYQNRKGIIRKISNLNFSSVMDLSDYGWTFVLKSDGLSNPYNNKIGSMLYKNSTDHTKGARIYENYRMYKYINYSDDALVESLQEKQPNVKLTEFPTGIITIENKVIGQLIPFYDNYFEFDNVINKNSDLKSIFDYGIKVIKIFKELQENDILYTDIHTGNILVNINTNDVKLVDFEQLHVAVNPDDNLKNIFSKHLVHMIRGIITRLGTLKGIALEDLITIANTLDDLEDSVLETSHKLIKK